MENVKDRKDCVNKLGLSCAKLTVVWLDLKLSFELKIEDKNDGDERKLG